MSDIKHTIWSDYNLDYADWQQDLESEHPDLTREQGEQMMHEINNEYLDDERINLDIQLSQPIIIIADIGRWNGRFSGYREIDSGNIRDCLYSNLDYATWYLDKKGDLRCEAIHHDGTNYYLYRVYKDDMSDAQMDQLKEKIYDGTVTRADITRVTKRLGDDIAKVYGWDIPRQGANAKNYER